MASYKKIVHTDKAFALIGKMIAGNISELEFTKIKVSDKDYSKQTEEELKKLTTLEQIKQETLISEKTPVGNNAVNIHGIIYNTDLQNSYYLRTIGVYANDPDEGEILYSITATEVGDYIPTPNGNNITTAIIDILTEIGEAEVNLSGNPSALVDVSMLNKKLDEGAGLEEEFNSAVKIVTELKKKQNMEDSTLKTIAKTIVGAINELFSNKLEKGGYTGTAKNLNDEISKKASTAQLGRIKVGKNLTITEDGTLSGNPQYTHPIGAGYNHIPAGGVVGQVLKNNGDGSAEWGDLSLDNYYNKAEIDSKFKKYCPVRVGDILLTSLTENPAETYLGTTWELLPENKFLKTGATPLQQNGNNSIKIAKENLPAEKLQVESHSHTQPVHGHKISLSYHYPGSTSCISAYDMGTGGDNLTQHGSNSYYSQSAGGENTGNSSPYTTNMGSGTPITINPEHITIKAWKRTK